MEEKCGVVLLCFFIKIFYICLTSQTTHAHCRRYHIDKQKESKDCPQSHYAGINTCITSDHLRAQFTWDMQG